MLKEAFNYFNFIISTFPSGFVCAWKSGCSSEKFHLQRNTAFDSNCYFRAMGETFVLWSSHEQPWQSVGLIPVPTNMALTFLP